MHPSFYKYPKNPLNRNFRIKKRNGHYIYCCTLRSMLNFPAKGIMQVRYNGHFVNCKNLNMLEYVRMYG